MADPPPLGPQYSRDNPMTARMRLHQSWYRAQMLGVPCGTGPRPHSTSLYGNMLPAEVAATGGNFLTPEIHAFACRRIEEGRGAVEPFRLLHNMLSSQPMCFNLLAPLAMDLDLATKLVRGLWGDRVARVTDVRLEFAPSPKADYLDDNTAFDGFIEYENANGEAGFAGIETKLTEPFSPGLVDKPTYRRWMTSDAPWRADAVEVVNRVEHNQLWRDHLLAWAMLRHPSSTYGEGALWVMYHPADHRCTEALEGYRGLLRDTSSLGALTLAEVLSTWQSLLGPGSWLDDFRLRYLDLERSEHLWKPPKSRAPDPARPAVRAGHLRAVRELEDTEVYQRTRALYRDALGGANVYLRPCNAGFTVLSLDSQHGASMVGVGGRDTTDHTIRQLPPDNDHVQRAVAGYLVKRDTLRRDSPEERYALELVDAALRDGLKLPRKGTYFVCQEWRLPSGAKIDLLGVDPDERALVVIELKGSQASAHRPDATNGKNAWQQAAQYAAELFVHRGELYPFFQRLARALALAHGAPEEVQVVELDPERPPLSTVSWSNEPGRLFDAPP